MPPKADFDLQSAHKFFAAECFNKTWDLIDKTERTPKENQQMVHLCQASIWHWTEREDCKPQNLSVGYWQAARVYALVGKANEAREYGQLSLKNANEAAPFYVGYAYEALARAEMVAGDRQKMAEYLALAEKNRDQVTDADSKKWLSADLESIK